jgi:hypothetical protein
VVQATTTATALQTMLLSAIVEVGECVFPEVGLYSFEVYFSARNGGEALKGEHPFRLVSHEE